MLLLGGSSHLVSGYISHGWPFAGGPTTLLRGFTNHGYYPLTNGDDPTSVYPSKSVLVRIFEVHRLNLDNILQAIWKIRVSLPLLETIKKCKSVILLSDSPVEYPGAPCKEYVLYLHFPLFICGHVSIMFHLSCWKIIHTFGASEMGLCSLVISDHVTHVTLQIPCVWRVLTQTVWSDDLSISSICLDLF